MSTTTTTTAALALADADGDAGAGAGARPTRTAGISLLAAGPACIVCATPFLWPSLAAMGLWGTSFIAHGISWLMVPLVVVLLARNARRHGERRPLRLAVAGAAVYAVHVVTHYVGALGDGVGFATDYVAVALLGTAALWDLAVTRRVRRQLSMVRQEEHRAGALAQ